MLDPSNDLRTDDSSKHGLSKDGKSSMSELKFKLTDSYGNAINLEGNDWHFALVVTEYFRYRNI